MDFNFIPFKLNADLNQFKGQIKYISSDNGVELYKVRSGPKMDILGILVSDVNLYFFEASLITVYIHLEPNTEDHQLVLEILEGELKLRGKVFMNDSGVGYYWLYRNEFLSLVIAESLNKTFLYLALEQFNVFGK